jgi:hypothetical protein
VAKCGTGYPKNHCLISVARWIKVRAMTKAIILIVGIVWASLLLVAWGGPAESHSATASVPALQIAR